MKAACSVIVRIATIVHEKELAEHVAAIEKNVIPSYQEAPGWVWVGLGKRIFVAYVELVILLLWRSEALMAQFLAEENRSAAVLGQGVIRMELRVFDLLVSQDGTWEQREVLETKAE